MREEKMDFKIHSKFQPTGDQPQAIQKIVENLEDGITDQILQLQMLLKK